MAPGARRAAVPGEQRVFSLVLALVASPEGILKRDLLSSVYGYSGRYVRGSDNSALERQFERDKEQLRVLGIPIDALDSPEESGNNQLTRYRISKDRLQIPSGLRFSERELMLLRLAALAWSEGSLTDEARRAAMKLEALGAGLDVRHLGVAPRLGIPEPSATPLQRAIDEGRAVSFAYRMPGRDTPLGRRVAPLQLHRADGRWHLIAHDLERDTGRVFLLSRVVGAVTVERERIDPALRDAVPGIVAELLQRQCEQRSVVDVREGSVAQARLSPRAEQLRRMLAGDEISDADHVPPPLPGWTRLVLGTLDYREHALADEIAGYGADATAVWPDELRDAVVARLREVRELHDADAQGAVGES